LELDVGQNLTELLQRLAEKIGTTTDKIFPWYVKQQVLEGYTSIVIILSLLTASIMIMAYNYKKANWSDSGFNQHSTITLAGSLVAVMIIFALILNGSEYITQILNPNYHALHNLLKDLSMKGT